jgi:hypothetical protein
MLNETIENWYQLNIPVKPHLGQLQNIKWMQYNPRKPIARKGFPLTSLDGGTSGIPELDSLREYNKINGTNFKESSFQTITPEGHELFGKFLNEFKCGRSNLMRLEAGGFFPWHRDLGSDSFRICYFFESVTPYSFVWIENDQVMPIQPGTWMGVNTKTKHCVFAFEQVTFAIFNILNTEENKQKLYTYLSI